MGFNFPKMQFIAGEVSESLSYRTDTNISASGASELNNFIVKPQGGVMNRAGTQYVGACRNLPDTPEVRLIPFQFSEKEGYVLEFSHRLMRVIQNGGYILETDNSGVLKEINITDITRASPTVITTKQAHGYADGNHITFTGIGGMSQMNGRIAVVASHTGDTITLSDIDGSPFDSTDFSAYTVPASGLSNGRIRKIYQKSVPYDSVDLPLLKYDQSADRMTLCHPDYPAKFLIRQNNAVWRLEDVVFDPTVSPPSTVTATGTEYIVADLDGITKGSVGTISFAGVGGGGSTQQSVFNKGSAGFIRSIVGMRQMRDKVIVLGARLNTSEQTYEMKRTSLYTINTTDYDDYTSGGFLEGDTLYRYRVTSVTSDGRESRPSDVVLVACKAMSALTDAGKPYPKIILNWETVEGATSYNVYRQREVPSGSPSTGSAYGFVGATSSPQFTDQNTSPDFTKTPPVGYNPFLEEPYSVAIESITQANPAVVTTKINHGLVDGDIVEFDEIKGMRELNGLKAVVDVGGSKTIRLTRVSDDTVVDSTSYNPFSVAITGVTKASKAVISVASHNFKLQDIVYVDNILGMVEMNDITGQVVAYTDTTITLKNTSTDSYIDSSGFSDYSSGGIIKSNTGLLTRKNPINNPVTTCYYQQRKVYGGSYDSPQNLWLSQTGDFENMDRATPIRDSDAIEVTLDSRQVNIIKHVVPLSTLLVLTSGACFKVGGGQNTAITPTSIQSIPQTYTGSSDIQPIVVNSDVLYIGAYDKNVNSLAFTFYSDSYTAQDLSVRAKHLFEKSSIKEWCSLYNPNNLILSVREDGVLLFFTYVKDAQIVAWSRGESKGEYGVDAFESVCSITENGEDVAYLVSRRYICTKDGCSFRRYIERLHSRNLYASGKDTPQPQDMLFTDCSVKYNGVFSDLGASTNTIANLHHLEGRTVSIVADGHYVGDKVVEGGKVTLDRSAVIVHVGLPYEARVKTLSLNAPDGSLINKKKTIGSIALGLSDARGVEVSLDGTNYVQAREAPIIAGRELELTTGNVIYTPPNKTTRESVIYIRQSNPLPCEILGFVADITLPETRAKKR